MQNGVPPATRQHIDSASVTQLKTRIADLEGQLSAARAVQETLNQKARTRIADLERQLSEASQAQVPLYEGDTDNDRDTEREARLNERAMEQAMSRAAEPSVPMVEIGKSTHTARLHNTTHAKPSGVQRMVIASAQKHRSAQQ